jgi:hypothetical protein
MKLLAIIFVIAIAGTFSALADQMPFPWPRTSSAALREWQGNRGVDRPICGAVDHGATGKQGKGN